MFAHIIRLYVLLLVSYIQPQGTIKLAVDAQDHEGEPLYVALYNSDKTFLSDAIFKAESTEISNGTGIIEFKDIPYGTYAISVFVDRINNGELDTKWMGIPKEPYAFSNNAKGSFGPPKFEEASFQVSQSVKQVFITID